MGLGKGESGALGGRLGKDGLGKDGFGKDGLRKDRLRKDRLWKESGKGCVDQERVWKKSRLTCIPAAAVFRFASVEPRWLPAAPCCPCPCPGRRGSGTSGLDTLVAALVAARSPAVAAAAA